MQKEGAAGEHGGDGALEAILGKGEVVDGGAGVGEKRREGVGTEVEGADGGDVAEIFQYAAREGIAAEAQEVQAMEEGDTTEEEACEVVVQDGEGLEEREADLEKENKWTVGRRSWDAQGLLPTLKSSFEKKWK